MKRQELIDLGFKEMSHFTIMNSLTYDLGRNRQLSFGSIGTANEMLYICEVDNSDNPTKVTDLVCLRNYDYDGYTSIEEIKGIIGILSSKNKGNGSIYNNF